MSSSVNNNHSNGPSDANGRPDVNSSGAHQAQNGISPLLKIGSYLTGQKETSILAQAKQQPTVVLKTATILPLPLTLDFCLRMVSISSTFAQTL